MSVLGKLEIRSTDDGYLREIGRIDDVHLGIEDHGIFSFNLGFDFGGTHQGIGHLMLGSPSRDQWAENGLKLLHDIAKACGRNLLNLKGTTVLVLRKSDEMHAPIVGIQPLIGGEPVVFDNYFPRA